MNYALWLEGWLVTPPPAEEPSPNERAALRVVK
jgi:hypothetical protein